MYEREKGMVIILSEEIRKLTFNFCHENFNKSENMQFIMTVLASSFYSSWNQITDFIISNIEDFDVITKIKETQKELLKAFSHQFGEAKHVPFEKSIN